MSIGGNYPTRFDNQRDKIHVPRKMLAGLRPVSRNCVPPSFTLIEPSPNLRYNSRALALRNKEC